MSEIVKKICPLATDLSREACTNIICPVYGCKKILSQLSALRFHKIKVHGIMENETDICIYRRQKSQDSRTAAVVRYQYHCPSIECIYSLNATKYFSTFKLLKQHYMKVHADKRHVCEACEASFGLHYDLSRHLKTCRLYRNTQLDCWQKTSSKTSSDDVSKQPTDIDITVQSTCEDSSTLLISNISSLNDHDVTSPDVITSPAPSNVKPVKVVTSSRNVSTVSVTPRARAKRFASPMNAPALLPKLNTFLLPVIIMPIDSRPRQLPIAPKTQTHDNCAQQRTVTEHDERPVCIATQCSRSTGELRRRAAETQTVGQFDHVSSRQRKKESTRGSSHVSPRSTGRKYRAICHSHTQTHGRHLNKHVVSPTNALSMSNATQTVDCGVLESTRTQTVESYLSHSELFNDTTWLPMAADLSRSGDESCVDLGDGSTLKPSFGVEYAVDRGAEIELFDSSREQFDRLLGELVEESTPRISFTSASQTVAIDLDAVSTQTMDCDFNTDDFDFSNTETQTELLDFDLSNTETQTELLDVLFGFSDIETQTAHQLQLWDSETQTCFDSLL